jgi:glycosyltransferase involved in cell wall biosynthesis
MDLSKPDSDPLVSVIIPTYNYGHFILFALESVVNQNYSNIEIVVVDDGSTDNTQEVLAGFSGINYVKQSNQGLSAARNLGMSLANGKYLQFLDADDILGNDSIRQRVLYLERNQHKSAVICRSAFFDSTQYSEEEILAIKHEWKQPQEDSIGLAFYYFNFAPVHAFLVRGSVVRDFSLVFDTKLYACEDYDFWFRLASQSGVPGIVKSCWVFYRQHGLSMSKNSKNQYLHDAELCRRLFASFCKHDALIGNHARADYLYVMLAASLVTAQRLWKVDLQVFSLFLEEHVRVLLDAFDKDNKRVLICSEAVLYFLNGYVAFLGMRYKDRSIGANFDKYIYNVFPDKKLIAVYIVKNFSISFLVTAIKRVTKVIFG